MRVKRDWILDPGLVLYLPLYELDGASFMSKDAYGHLCTVTGALWRPNGHYFDGFDDIINCGSGSALDNIFDGGGTIIAWINPASDGGGSLGRIFDKSTASSGNDGWNFFVFGEAASKVKLKFSHAFSGDDGRWVTTNTAIDLSTFSCVGITYNNDDVGNDPTFYKNGIAIGAGDITEELLPVNTRTDDAAQSLYLGNNVGTARAFHGMIGEVWIYNRHLSLLELQSHFLATKWRYR